MADVIVIGDGPAGLSGALFLGRNGLNTTLIGADASYAHRAHFFNYLGIESIDGSDFIARGRRQVKKAGVEVIEATVTSIEKNDDAFVVITDEEETFKASYILFAAGTKARKLAVDVGVEQNEDGSLKADRDGRTAVDNFYAAGWTARSDKIQAIISAGDGAAAALDILSREAGEDVHDFDTPADAKRIREAAKDRA